MAEEKEKPCDEERRGLAAGDDERDANLDDDKNEILEGASDFDQSDGSTASQQAPREDAPPPEDDAALKEIQAKRGKETGSSSNVPKSTMTEWEL